MAVDSSATPITNTTTTQLNGVKSKLNNAVSYTRDRVKQLEEKVAEYNNPRIKDKDPIVAEIKQLKSDIEGSVNKAVDSASNTLKDVTQTVNEYYMEAQEMYAMLAPLMNPPTSPDAAVGFCKSIANLVKKLIGSQATKKADTTAAVAIVAADTNTIKSDISELNSLSKKADGLVAKFK